MESPRGHKIKLLVKGVPAGPAAQKRVTSHGTDPRRQLGDLYTPEA